MDQQHTRIDRVVINKHGEAVPPARAIILGIKIDVLFIRKDGWTLAASEALSQVAYNLWSDEWVSFYSRLHDKTFPISEFTVINKKEAP